MHAFRRLLHSIPVIVLGLLAACGQFASVPAADAPTPLRATATLREVTPAASPTLDAPVTPADVLFVRARLQSTGSWSFEVTVQHADTGWEHYADRWEVRTGVGEVLATRVLAHPHVGEQPFTRSQSGITIPADVTRVWVRAHDLVDGYGGREVLVDLASSRGESFEVER